jgi:hypothetical protein
MTKAYKVIEEIQSGEVLVYSDTTRTAQRSMWVGLYKETNPFPLVEYEETLLSTGTVRAGGGSLATASWSDLTDRLIASADYKTLSQYIFPISRFKTILALYNFQATSAMTEIATGTSASKDECRRIFLAVNQKGDYRQKDPAMDAIGGLPGLSKMMQQEFGIREMPAGENSWNYNLPVGWGKSVKGLGFETVAKATVEAVIKIYKKQVEKHDPNISLAHKLMLVTKMLNLNIPTLAWSFMILPANVFPPPVGIGPPLTPLGVIYHALGLSLWQRTKDAEDETSKTVNDTLASLGVGDGTSNPVPCDETFERTAYTGTKIIASYSFGTLDLPSSNPLVTTTGKIDFSGATTVDILATSVLRFPEDT